MKNKLVILAILGMMSGVASAQNLDNFNVSVGVNGYNDAGSDTGTGYNVGIGYKYDLNSKWFVEPELKYATANDSPWNATFTYANIDVGYKFNLNNGYTLSPRAGYTYYYSQANQSSNNTGNGYNVGLELGINRNWAVETTYTYFEGQTSGHWGSLAGVNLKYNF